MNIITRKEDKERGLTRYFTGNPCKYGHVAERWTAAGKCLDCHYYKNPLKPRKTLSEEERKKASKLRAARWYRHNKQETIDRAREWKRLNKRSVRESERRWRKKDTSKAICFMRDSLRRVLKIEKKGRTEHILGYTRRDLLSHIEKQFSKGMSWENHGEWHIDHIVPVSELIAQGETDPAVINALSNLRPIWEADNRSKGARVETLL